MTTTTVDTDFVALRRYTRREAAELLHVPETWLKKWVTERAVPHQRSGAPGPRQRGVWFTYDDIRNIGAMLPELMSARQANSLAARPAQSPGIEPEPELRQPHLAGAGAAQDREPAAESRGRRFTAEELSALAELRSLKRA